MDREENNQKTTNKMEWNSGVVRFGHDIFVDDSVLGKTLVIKQNKAYIILEFPVANVQANNEGIDYLEKPTHALNYKVRWGEVYQRPVVKAGVVALACYTSSIDDGDLFNILSEWRRKFIDLMEIENECLIPKSPEIKCEKFSDGTIDFYSGISMSRLLPNGSPVPIHDLRNPEPIKAYIISKECYADFSAVSKAVIRAFQNEPLPQTYHLLLDAYHAFKNSDFRSAITLGGIALEHCILGKIKNHAKENGIIISYPIGELGKKFDTLKDLNIKIPIQNYKDYILKLRNAVLHEGIQVEEYEAYKYLKNCRTIIDEYEPLF